MKHWLLIPALLAATSWLTPLTSQTPGTRVTLRTGARIEGEVRSKGYEAIRGGRFIAVGEDASGAGLRLYRPQGALGYMFIPRTAITTIRHGIRLVDAQVDRRAILRAWGEWRAREREAMHAIRSLRRAAEEDARRAAIPAPPPTLLERFPPDAGFEPDLLDELHWRGNVIGVYPSAEQREWLDHYDAWLREYEQWKAKPSKTEK